MKGEDENPHHVDELRTHVSTTFEAIERRNSNIKLHSIPQLNKSSLQSLNTVKLESYY